MEPKLKLYEVTVHSTAVRYVLAGDSMEAERIADDDVDSFDFERDYAEASEVRDIKLVSADDRDECPLMPSGDSEWTIEEWFAAGERDPREVHADALGAWRSSRPSAVFSLAAWLAREPRRGRIWCAPMDGGGAIAADGHGCLIVDHAEQVVVGGPHANYADPIRARESAAKLMRPGLTAPTSASAIRTWLSLAVNEDDTPIVQIAGVRLDAGLVERWLLPVLDLGIEWVEAGTMPIDGSHRANAAGVFIGDGWRVVIMPRVSDADAPMLKVGRPMEVSCG